MGNKQIIKRFTDDEITKIEELKIKTELLEKKIKKIKNVIENTLMLAHEETNIQGEILVQEKVLEAIEDETIYTKKQLDRIFKLESRRRLYIKHPRKTKAIEMFGRRVKDLTTQERREYWKIIQREYRKRMSETGETEA